MTALPTPSPAPVGPADLTGAVAALTEAELAEQPAQRYLLGHVAALRVAAVVLAYRTVPRRRSAGPRDVWQVLAEVAPEYAEWAGFFGFSALKRQAVQAGAVALVGVREADDLLRDVRLFHDQVASRLRRAALVETLETSTVASAAAELHGHVAPEPSTVPASPTTVIPANARISKPHPERSSSTVIPANAGISSVERVETLPLVELVETPSPRIAREITSDVDAAHAQQAPRGAESGVISRPEPAAPPSVIPADAGISTTAELAPAGRTAS